MRTYQLFAHTPVWRVVEIVHTTTTGDGRPRLLTGRVAYRWTRRECERCGRRWLSSAPRPAVIERWACDDGGQQ